MDLQLPKKGRQGNYSLQIKQIECSLVADADMNNTTLGGADFYGVFYNANYSHREGAFCSDLKTCQLDHI